MTVVYDNFNPVITGTFYGNSNQDAIWAGQGMPPGYLEDFDFSKAIFNSFEQINYNWMAMDMPGKAIFASSQFGDGLIANNVEIYGAWGRTDLIINLVGNLDASGWQFKQGPYYNWVTGEDYVFINGAAGNQTVKGSSVSDTFVFKGNYSDYSFNSNGTGGLVVKDNVSGRDGIDTLTAIEELRFSDISIKIDANGNPIIPTVNVATAILWQNHLNGDVIGWSIQDNVFKSWGYVGSTGSNSPWRIEAQGNFDSNPGVDIVWKNSASGAVYIWDTVNNQFAGGGPVGAVGPTSGWEIVASGNFNNDSFSDLLWQNSITNDIYIWNVQNNAFAGGSLIGNAGANSGWQAKAVGEFDGTGNADILWQNKFSGDVYIWNITNNQVSDQRFVGSVGVNTGWEIKDVGNFNNDSYSDILWQNSITGDVYIWDIVNNAISGGGYVGSVGANSGWQIQNAGLYNADSFSDILWHNSVSGEAYIWNISNNVAVTGASLGAPPTQWGIAPVNSPIA